MQQATPAPDTSATAVAVHADKVISIDGRDTEEVWAKAQRYSNFRQFQPKVNVDPTFKTEFRVAYDERNLYVFIRMFDPHPDSIMRALTRRDVRGSSDQIKIIVDSYKDKRSGYEFAVNPDGVKRDYAMSNDGNEDQSWNGIWDVATTVDSLGWTAEFQIPLSQMRYARSAENKFGFGVWRDIERFAERTSWPLYNPQGTGLSSQLATIDGLAGLSSERRMEALPYTVTRNVQRVSPGGYSRQQEVSVGGDLKVGITPNTTLDATINPDFGQVESDPSVVNLSAFETFLSEKRPFFVEGTGLYKFQLNCYIVVDCSTSEGLFYTRRIGRSPALRGLYGDAETPAATSIAAATKLTGRTANGLAFGVLEAVTRKVEGTLDRTAEPLTNFSVVRAQQDLRGGDAGISFIGTAVNRSVDEWTDRYMHKSAYTAGATFRNRFGNKRYELAGLLAASTVLGTPEAIYRTQRSSAHYFQQPNDKLVVDSGATSLSGYSGQLKFGKYSGGYTRFETSLVRHSAGFEANDLGYLRRADITDWSTWGSLSTRNANDKWKWAAVNGNHWEQWNTSGTRLQNAFNFNTHVGLLNNWDIHGGLGIQGLGRSFCDRCTRGGPLLRRSRGIYPWFGVNTDGRARVAGGMWVNFGTDDEGNSTGNGFSPYVNFRLSPQFQLNVGTDFGNDHLDAQWFGNFTQAGVTHYSFAHLDQQTTAMSVRMNYTVTRDLSFELYGQPFVAKGTYSNIREISSTPDADSYDARFKPFTPPAGAQTQFKVTELIANSVVRWEYRPGSTMFFVWQHGRQGPGPNDRFNQSWTRDYSDIFKLHPDNTFLIKVAYWLSR